MLHRLINGLVDIVYPKTCLACKKKLPASLVDGVICGQCWAKIKKNRPPFCHFCGRHLEARNFVKNICSDCLRKKLHFDRAFSPCTYEGIVKELIHAFKYNGKDYLGSALSRLMIEFIREYHVPVRDMDLIIPMPLYHTRLREREFNQAQILGKYIAAEFNKDVALGALQRHRLTRTQTELEPQARFANVRDSFCVAQDADLKAKNILLVDDVFTTGATASEAASVLKGAGANIVFVLTLAN